MSIPRPLNFTVLFPQYTAPDGPATPTIPEASVTFKIPDNSLELYSIGISLAGLAANVVSIASSIQTIIEPTGGIRLKDQLDPYQYQIVTDALAANSLPIPPAPPLELVTVNPLGGAMAVTGTLTGLAAGAAAAGGSALVQEFFPGLFSGSSTLVGPGFPDYASQLLLISSALGIINTALGTTATLLNNSVDVPSRSLLVKTVLAAFNVAVNTQAITTAGRVAPPSPTGL